MHSDESKIKLSVAYKQALKMSIYMAPPCTGSPDGSGGEKIIYSHFSLKPQKFPLPYQLCYEANLQLHSACQVLSRLVKPLGT